MESDEFYTYLRSIKTIESQEALLGIKVHNYHAMKSEDQESLNSVLFKDAYPLRKDKVLTVDEFTKVFGG